MSSRNYSTKHDEVYRLMNELEDNKKITLIKDVGSIRHFKYIGE